MRHVPTQPPVIFTVERTHVEACDFMPLVAFFRSQGPDVSEAAILSLMGYLTLVVSGYDEDPRELWQVPEVRAYFILN